MELQVVFLPDPANGRFTKILGSSHSPRAPMRRTRRGGVQGCFDHGFNFPRLYATRPGRVFFQSGQSESQKTLSPQLHGGTRYPQFASDVLTQRSARCHSNNLGPLHQSRRKASSMSPRLQSRLFLERQDDGLRFSAHRALASILYLSSYL
jgi:hypothetical protein